LRGGCAAVARFANSDVVKIFFSIFRKFKSSCTLIKYIFGEGALKMEKIKNDEIIQHLNWRYATKKFDTTKKISANDWMTLEEALRLSPSSSGLQPWKFMVVLSPEVRKKLTPASYNQQQVEQCSHLVVVTHLRKLTEEYVDKYFNFVYHERGMPKDALKGFRDNLVNTMVKGPAAANNFEWTSRQAYIAMGVFMTTAAMLNIDVCPMEGIEPAKYDDILGLTNSPYAAVSIMAAGYRAADDQMQKAKKVRFDKSDIIQIV
jgi:nitroreductase